MSPSTLAIRNAIPPLSVLQLLCGVARSGVKEICGPIFLFALLSSTALLATESHPGELEIEMVGKSLHGRLSEGLDLDAREIVLEDQRLPLRDVLRIRFRQPAAGQRWNTALRLADGTRIHGHLKESSDPDLLSVQVPSLSAPLRVPLEWVREVRRGVPTTGAAPATTEDRIETTRNASITGVIESIEVSGVTIEDPSLGTLEVPWEQIERVLVAPLDPPPALSDPSIPCFVETSDGSRFNGSLKELSRARCQLESPLLGTITIEEEHCVELEVLLNRIAYLSDRAPISVEEGIPFSDYFPWRYQRDRNVLGGPLRIGRETFRKGLGVHSKSSLKYSVEPGDLLFRSMIGVDVVGRPVDDNPHVGSVRFVVLLDGEEVWRSKDVGWSDPPQPIEIPLEGHRELTLVVEMGLGHHVLDRANWADARILRE